ncbi:CmcI family methyltransferase [Jiella sp. M17.18]|uniref:CmcI family methyltransferase n=1 Tax=Jiella sp. M17.18 TaxID=3234247 RepID=UPI0034DF4FE0
MWPFTSKKLTRPKNVGSYRPSPSGPRLREEELETIRRFHELYYRRWSEGGQTISVGWLGYETLKCPLDLWIYQELVISQKPDVIIETGTRFGGSARFFASLCEEIGHGHVVTVDIDQSLSAIRPAHERITYLDGSSLDPDIRARIDAIVGDERCLIVLDSDHSCDHVLAELKSYAPLVQPGGYLIVEDTNVNGHPALPDFGPGPMEAVDAFLEENADFEPDPDCERFLMTLNPRGYLRRKA